MKELGEMPQKSMPLFILTKIFEFYESSFFEKLLTYSGLVSGYMWSKKGKKKENLIFFLSKKYHLSKYTYIYKIEIVPIILRVTTR
jgi:hypothetical protein